jgi:predicted enzyme related to lactoylglutathione lyase
MIALRVSCFFNPNPFDPMAKKAAKKTAKKAASKKASSSSSSGMGMMLNHFNWNELLTTDEKGAKTFYTKLFGWKTKPFGQGMDYTIFEDAGKPVGGMMKCPMPGVPPHWLAYVSVKDIKASTAKAKKLGAVVVVEPFPIPGVGQIAILQDPQGAAFGLHASA